MLYREKQPYSEYSPAQQNNVSGATNRLPNAGMENHLGGLLELAGRLYENLSTVIAVKDGEQWESLADQDWDKNIITSMAALWRATIQGQGVLVINDVKLDERFSSIRITNGKGEVRFFAGAPLINKNGDVLGVFCLIDHKPRHFTEEQERTFSLLADEMVSRLESALKDVHLKEKNSQLERAHIFLENSSDVQAILDPETLCYLDINREITKLIGISREEIIGTTFGSRILDVGIRNQIKEFLNGYSQQRKMFMVPLRGKTGRTLYQELTFTLHDGLWYMTARDQTGKQRYRKELRKRSQAIDTAHDGIAIFDEVGRINYVNTAKSGMYGYKNDELLGKNWRMLFNDETIEEFENTALPALRLQGYWQGETMGKRKDQTVFPIEMTVSHLSEGGYVLIARDITDRKKTENELHETLTGLENAQQIARLANWEWNVITGEMKWSNEIYELFDLDPDMIPSNLESYIELVHPGDLDDIIEVIENMKAGKRYENIRHRVMLPGGITKYIHIRTRSFANKKGKTARVVGTAQDVTEQMTIEKNLRDILKEKEILLSEIHHRVKNNLAVISGLLELEAFQVEDELVQTVLTNSQARIKSMAIVHEKLYRSGNFDKISFDNYMRDVLDFIQSTYYNSHKSIEIEHDLQPVNLNVNQAIPCGLILNELVINAFEHAFENRDSGIIHINLSEDGQQIHLQVTDNGNGFPEHFDSTKSESLGFTLIQNLTQQLEGELELSSNKGTVIDLRFQKSDVKGSGSAFDLN